MKTLKDLTPEIIAKIPEYQKKAIEGVFDGKLYENFDLKKAKEAIKWNYEKCGYKMPIVLVAENPLEQQLMFNYVKLIFKNLQFDSQLDSQLNSQLESQLDSQFYSQLNLQLNSQLRSQLYSQLYSQLNSQLYSQLESQLDSQLDSQFYLQLRSQLNLQLRSQLDLQLGSQLNLQLNSQLNSQLYSQLNSQLNSQLYSQLNSQLYSQLESQLRSQLNLQLDSQYIQNLKTYHNTYLFTLNVYSQCYYTWYKFIKEEFNLPLTIAQDFEECFRLQKASGIYSCIFSKEIVIICKYPKKIHQRVSGGFELNNVNGQAVEWSSLTGISFDCYYVNGVNISKELFDKLSNKEVTFQDFIKEENEEIKSTILSFYQEKFGEEFIFRFLSETLKEINTYVDKKKDKYLKGTTKGMNIGVYTLFKGKLEENEIAYVRCYCPSTDRMFFLGVEPKFDNAKDAIASLYRVPKKLVDEIESIQRQGKNFAPYYSNIV